MMDSLRGIGALIARILIAFIFVSSGLGKILNPVGTMKYMAAGGLPHGLIPALFVLSVVIELLGGILLIVGWQAEWVALIIFLFCIPVTVIFHMIPGQTIQWHKNLAFMGGLLMIAVQGAGGLSIDSLRRARRAQTTRAAA